MGKVVNRMKITERLSKKERKRRYYNLLEKTRSETALKIFKSPAYVVEGGKE